MRLVRDSIKLLYLKGLFKNIIAEGRDTPEGTIITFRLIPKLRISKIRFEGNDLLSKKKIAPRMTLKEGDFIESRQVKASTEAVLKFYHDEGFPHAQVSLEPKELSPLTAELVVHIQEGPPTIISEVRIVGEPGLPEEDLLKKAKKDNIKKGKRLRKDDLENAVTALSDYYVKEDYVKAEVAPKVTVSGDKAEVDFKVKAGPKLAVDFEGNDQALEEEAEEGPYLLGRQGRKRRQRLGKPRQAPGLLQKGRLLFRQGHVEDGGSRRPAVRDSNLRHKRRAADKAGAYYPYRQRDP